MPLPEYMRVRAHLYNLVAKSDGTELQIPPENELCRLFDVSRITVRGAIRGLVRDKLLVPRRGVGTFINPKKISREEPRFPVVGLLQGDGRNILAPCDPDLTWSVWRSGMWCELLHLPDSDAPDRLVEIVRAGLDGVIWKNSAGLPANRKYISALTANGIPLLLVEDEEMPAPGNDCVLSSRGQRGVALADHLHAKGHRKALFIHNHPASLAGDLSAKGSTYAAFRARMTELDGGGRRNSTSSAIRSFSEFRELLTRKSAFLHDYTVIYSSSHLVQYIMAALRAAGISVPDDLSYLLYGDTDPYLTNGLRADHLDTASPVRRALLEWLDTRVHKKELEGVFTREIAMNVESGKTVKTIA